MSKSPSGHLIRLQGKIKTEKENNYIFIIFIVFFNISMY